MGIESNSLKTQLRELDQDADRRLIFGRKDLEDTLLSINATFDTHGGDEKARSDVTRMRFSSIRYSKRYGGWRLKTLNATRRHLLVFLVVLTAGVCSIDPLYARGIIPVDTGGLLSLVGRLSDYIENLLMEVLND